jgi:hypothetical protein
MGPQSVFDPFVSAIAGSAQSALRPDGGPHWWPAGPFYGLTAPLL